MPRYSALRHVLLAPSASCGAALRFPARDDTPPIDSHIVRTEVTRDELVRGRRLVAQPARAPHGDRHFEIDYVVGAHIRPGYVGSTDLITRYAEGSDFATDTCVRRAGIDPETEQRYLEELAFEVVHEQSLKDMSERAEEICARGVRRLIAVFVKKGEVKEWSAPKHTWMLLDPDGEISDPCLLRPIKVRALLDAATADDEVTRAVLAKRTPALVQHEASIERKTKAEAILTVLTARGIPVDDDTRARILGCVDLELLDRWLAQAGTIRSIESL